MSWRIGLIQRISLDGQTGCWNWRGAKAGAGYGLGWYKGKKIYAHRLAAILWLKMSVEDKRQVLHRCDNPLCFNPKHLFIGTQLDNVLDMIKKGRNVNWNRGKVVCINGHAFSPENTRYHRSGKRECIQCKRNRYIAAKSGVTAHPITDSDRKQR